MKCSVCAQDIPEDRYAEHLETEHGVTDDPTAVLIQHLTGLHTPEADTEEAADELPNDEPSDADAFEEFLGTHPADEEDEAEQADEEAEPAAADDEGEQAAVEGDELSPDDESEFERMLAAYPTLDARKTTVKKRVEPEEDSDARTFAVWDEARGVAPGTESEAEGEGAAGAAAAGGTATGAAAAGAPATGATATAVLDDDVVVVPPAELERARRRRQAALLGLAAVVILIAIAVVYLLTRDNGTKTNNTAAVAPVTTPTTVSPTFLPGPAGGETTTVPVTQPPVGTSVPVSPAPSPTPTPTPTTAGSDPAAQIAFSYIDASCISGRLSVRGTATNNNNATYSFRFNVQIVNPSGAVLGQAQGAVDHLAAHAKAGFVATGTCTNVTGGHPQQQITSITPG